MNCIRLADSELEGAMLILQTTLDLSFDGDLKDHKMGLIANIMFKQVEKLYKEKWYPGLECKG